MLRIRIAAKALIVRDGALLLVRCADDDGEWYMLPGGGQTYGEPLDAALRRECREEIRAEVEVGRLALVRDYIVAHHEFAGQHDNDDHQVELMFECTLAPGAEPAVGDAADGMQTGVDWVALDRLGEVRIYPKLLPQLLRDGVPQDLARYLGDVN